MKKWLAGVLACAFLTGCQDMEHQDVPEEPVRVTNRHKSVGEEIVIFRVRVLHPRGHIEVNDAKCRVSAEGRWVNVTPPVRLILPVGDDGAFVLRSECTVDYNGKTLRQGRFWDGDAQPDPDLRRLQGFYWNEMFHPIFDE